MKRSITGLIAASLALLAAAGPVIAVAAAAGKAPAEGGLGAGPTARAVEVIDGDTLVLDDGR
ncbi:MAG: hypothetical protein ACE5JZ_13510, partial [Kiloniellales bacterium]